jgi:hypothetical protein
MGVAVGISCFVSIVSRPRDICTSGLTAAYMDFRLPVTSDSNRNSAFEFMNPKNIDSAVEISLLGAT